MYVKYNVVRVCTYSMYLCTVDISIKINMSVCIYIMEVISWDYFCICMCIYYTRKCDVNKDSCT